MTVANILVNVEGYLQDHAVHVLQAKWCVTRTLNDRYASYTGLNGTLGPKFLVNLPSRTTTDDNFGFDASTPTAGEFSQRSLGVTANKEVQAKFSYTDIEHALFDQNDAITQTAMSNLNEIAARTERYYIQQVTSSGYRFFGSPAAINGQMTSVSEVTNAVAKFDSFGCVYGEQKYCIMPMTKAASTIQTGLQQFVPRRNETLALAGEIGNLGGVPDVVYCNSNLLDVHTSGTIANDAINLNTGYTITSITPSNTVNPDDANGDNTSVVVLSGVPAGLTILADDMIDIGALNSADPIRFLTFGSGYARSENQVQGRVVADAVEAGGSITFTVQPAYIFDGTNVNAYRNLSRAFDLANDTVRVVKSHGVGLLYFGQYGFRVNPKLPNAEPYSSATIKNKETGTSIRAYYGQAGVGGAYKYFVHQCLLGYGAATEGFARIIYGLD